MNEETTAKPGTASPRPIFYGKPAPYYWMGTTKQIFIIADGPGGQEAMEDMPHIPAMNEVALKQFSEVIHSKMQLEEKLALLKEAIKSL